MSFRHLSNVDFNMLKKPHWRSSGLFFVIFKIKC